MGLVPSCTLVGPTSSSPPYFSRNSAWSYSETLRRRKPLTPVLCDGVKKDPSPSLGDMADAKGVGLVAEDKGDTLLEADDEGEFMIREYMPLSRSKSD
jgi:hypothetical protein